MSVVSVVLEGPAADGPAEDDLELRSVVALTAGRSLFHLVSGSLVLFHALLLPFRSAFGSLEWGNAANQPAFDAPQFLHFALTLYVVDAVFVIFRLTPLVRARAKRVRLAAAVLERRTSQVLSGKAEPSASEVGSISSHGRRMSAGFSDLYEQLQAASARSSLSGDSLSRGSEDEGEEDEEDAWKRWRKLRCCLAVLELVRRLAAWLPVDVVFLLSGAPRRRALSRAHARPAL